MKIIKGDILFAKEFDVLCEHKDSYLVSKNGKIVGIYQQLPSEYCDITVDDCTGKLIIPAFCDMHLHASQFYQRGIGMDVELLEWLEKYTFKNESRFSNQAYADEVYTKFVDEIIKHGTFSSAIFATVHNDATSLLFKKLHEKGLNAYVGKVNMDDNCPDFIKEDTNQSAIDTEKFINEHSYSKTVKPIVTPRFSPSCTEKLHEKLGEIAIKTNTPVQSHLNENRGEIEWVKSLFPKYDSYASVYAENNLFGQTKTLMAHCVHMSDDDIDLMAKNGVYAVHCPDSNVNVQSGIMPVKKLVERGVRVTLGSDIGGGETVAMYKAMASAIKASKLLKFTGENDAKLNVCNVLYMATKSGGEFFGKVGSFEENYDMTAIVIDDENLQGFEVTTAERLERFLYLGDDRNIVKRYILGEKIEI